MTPLMPANLIDMNTFQAPWRKSGRELFKRCRELASENDFVQRVLWLKDCYFARGVRAGVRAARALGTDQTESDARRAVRAARANGADLNDRIDRIDGELLRLIRQLSDDAWTEYLVCQAAVAFWRRPAQGEGLPAVTILDCEDLEYTEVFGVGSLKVFPKKMVLTEDQKRALGPRLAEAVGTGKPLTLDRDLGECWKVLKLGKAGSSGLGTPRMAAILDMLSQRELLKIGDWAGAWTIKDVIRQIKKGHEITQGPLAGQPQYFLKNAERKRIADQMKNKGGAYTAITNWDLYYGFVHLDPKYFDAKKYEGVHMHLAAWAGPVELMRREGTVSPYLIKAFENEGLRERERVAAFIEEILSDPDLVGDGEAKVPEGIKVGWDPHAFKNLQEIYEWVRAGSNGQVSPQSQREALGVDDAAETALMREAHKRRMDYTPPFEPRQGLLDNPNGRPKKESSPAEAPEAGRAPEQ